jgi:putative transposase
MSDILPFVQCLVCLDTTTLRRLVVIVSAVLAMTGRVTMLGISRWTEGKGGSYRTVQRFFNTKIDWDKVHWFFVQAWFIEFNDIYILAGDEVVVTKAGTETHGLDKFYASLFGKPVPGLSFFTFSLISTTKRTAYPLMTKQLIRSESETAPPAEKPKKKKGPGRPKGSLNKNKENVELSSYLLFIQEMLTALLLLMSIDVRYVVFDGAFGTNYALQMVRRCGSKLSLISKLQYNSALYFPYQGPYRGRGPRKKYGDKIDYKNIPAPYLKETSLEDGIQTNIYQMKMLHKLFPQVLNVVIIVKLNLQTGASAHVILFSSDLALAYDKLIDYYRLRFQIEFNFRDAKQYWGLEDFMNVKEQAVTNAANLAFFMCNMSQALMIEPRQQNPKFSVNDLKAHFRGLKYVTETLKLLPQIPDPIFIQQIIANIALIGSINTS